MFLHLRSCLYFFIVFFLFLFVTFSFARCAPRPRARWLTERNEISIKFLTNRLAIDHEISFLLFLGSFPRTPTVARGFSGQLSGRRREAQVAKRKQLSTLPAILAAGAAARDVSGCQTLLAVGVHWETGDGGLERGHGPGPATSAMGRTRHRHAQAQARRVLGLYGPAERPRYRK